MYFVYFIGVFYFIIFECGILSNLSSKFVKPGFLQFVRKIGLSCILDTVTKN